MKIRSLKFLLFIGAVFLFINACDSDRVFDAYVTVPDAGWNKDSLAVFDVDIKNADMVYNLYLNIRNQSDYPNSNLWLFVDVISPSGIIQRDTVDCILADKTGRWLGSGWGSMYQVNAPYRFGVKFPEIGNYQFRLCHGMRTETLDGIHNIGIRIERATARE